MELPITPQKSISIYGHPMSIDIDTTSGAEDILML